MKNIISKLLSLGAFFLLVFVLTTELKGSDKFKLTVSITNVESNDGQLFVYLYDKPEYYPKEKDKAFKVVKTKISNNKAKLIFEDIPKGTYAIAVHHDDNGNNKVDTNFLGIPSEDFGASNNAKGFMGPPSFEDASFKVTDNKEVNIDMN